jgi:hypothetical protein
MRALAAALVLALVACGGDDDDADSATHDALVRQLTDEGFSRETAECATDEFIRVVPKDEAERSAADPDYVLPDELLADATAEVAAACPDFMREGVEKGIFDEEVEGE